jgi:hypothetical protein
MADRVTITFKDEKLERQIREALRRNPVETAKAVRECVLDLAANSAKQAPVDTGDLRNNCHASINNTSVFANQTPGGVPAPALSMQGTVGYSLPYALRQHEALENNHPKGGNAKFLEAPFEQRKDRYLQRIQRIPEDVTK